MNKDTKIMCKKKTRTLAEKLKIIQDVENNPNEKRVDIAKRLGLTPSTLNTIISNFCANIAGLLIFNRKEPQGSFILNIAATVAKILK